SAILSTPDGQRGLHVDYFASRAMQDPPLFSGTDTTLDANWGDGAPRADMNVDDFGVRWTGTIKPPATGPYRLALIGTVKVQRYPDDSLVFRSVYATHDGEFPDPRMVQSEPLHLEAGRSYRLRIDGQETYGDAQLQLLWSPPHEHLEAEAVAAAQQANAVV